MTRFRWWPGVILIGLGCVAVSGCKGGPGAAGTPGNGAQAPAATGAAHAQSGSGAGGSGAGGSSGSSGKTGGHGGSGGGGAAFGAPIHIPYALLVVSGSHSVEQGIQDAKGILASDPRCGSSLCHVGFNVEGTRTECIGSLAVTSPGRYDPSDGFFLYPGVTITIVGAPPDPCPDNGSSDSATPSPSDTGPIDQTSPPTDTSSPTDSTSPSDTSSP